MTRILVDENMDFDFYADALRHLVGLDMVRVQDVGLRSVDDPAILAYAAQENRILLTHDVNTMPKFAYDRVRHALPMPGVIAVHSRAPIGRVIEDLTIAFECGIPTDWENRVVFVPIN